MKEDEKSAKVVQKSAKGQTDNVVDKKAVRLQELLETYEIIRSK